MDDKLLDVISEMVKRQTSDMSQRRSAVVRKYGEEHSANFVHNKATFYIPVDTDMEYISELQVKFLLGDIGGMAISGGGSVNLVDVPVGTNTYPTYASWVSAVGVGQGVNVDGYYGLQCWDYACAFWRAQTGRTLQTGPNGCAYECWTVSRVANAGSEFDLITDKGSIKVGDWVVTGGGAYGHISMASSTPSNGKVMTYGQNQGGVPHPEGGAYVSQAEIDLTNFLGAFRYKNWN